MIELAQSAESQELNDALEKLSQEAVRLQTVIDMVPSFLWTSLPDGSSTVPAAFALFPADIGHPPREWGERFFNVQRWTEMPRGGHFAAMEEPELLAVDLREWFRQFR